MTCQWGLRDHIVEVLYGALREVTSQLALRLMILKAKAEIEKTVVYKIHLHSTGTREVLESSMDRS